MAINHKAIFCVLFVLSIFSASSKVAEMRPLVYVEQVKWKQQGLVLQSLPKGGPSTSSPNPCTYVSGHSKGTCTLNGMNVAGGVVRTPPNFPGLTVDVSVASEGHHLDEHQSSSLASV